MGQLKNVTFIKQANIYFDGKVTSRKVILQDGSVQTFGIMLPGDYEFSTEAAEEMAILEGGLRYQIVGESWQEIDGQGVFHVPANSTFKLQVARVTDYCCSYK